MLSVNQVSKRFGEELILDRVSFNLNAGDRLALIGPNGCGKSTLLAMIAGTLAPDQGKISTHPQNLIVGYLPQAPLIKKGDSISDFMDRTGRGLREKSAELEKLASEIAANPHTSDLQEIYDQLLVEVSSLRENEGETASALTQLGLGDIPEESLVSKLSGGQQTRLSLAGVLRSRPQLLILDEPTNHLDLPMLEWLEDWFIDFQGGILFVSHDRAFINKTATGILELGLETRQTQYYPGNYSDYLVAKLNAREKQQQAFTQQQAEISRLRSAIERKKGEAKYKKGGKADSDKFAKGFYKNRSAGTIKRAKQLEKRIEYLQNAGKVDKPGDSWQLKIDFNDNPEGNRKALTLDNLSVGYGTRVLIERINQEIRLGERIALTGENGIGKTTLIRTILKEIPPLSGTARLGVDIQAGYMAQTQSELNLELNVLESLQGQAALSETDLRRFLSYFLFTGDDVFKNIGQLSFGERARLSLAGIVAGGCNFLILDEPINHLDIPSRSRFEQALTLFNGAILAVVHDRYFIDGFATRIWEVEERHINSRPVGNAF